MSDEPKLLLNFADGTPWANLTLDQARQLLDLVENDFVQSDPIRELADGLRRSIAYLAEDDEA